MKATITVVNRYKSPSKVLLFGTRHNYIRPNYGNTSWIDFKFVEYDDDYKSMIGDSSFIDDSYSAFLSDLVKNNFRVQKINGEPLKKIKKDAPVGTVEYDDVPFNTFNPYYHDYFYEIPAGESKIEVELRNIDN